MSENKKEITNINEAKPRLLVSQEHADALEFFTGCYNRAKADFPDEALSTDSSRGFDLTSVKAQYVVERLNDVFGINGWEHTGQYEKVMDGDTIVGIVYSGQLVVHNGAQAAKREAVGHAVVRDLKRIGDAYKGAKTDSLGKCASQVGVANDVFKGLVEPPKKGAAKKTRNSFSKAESF